MSMATTMIQQNSTSEDSKKEPDLATYEPREPMLDREFRGLHRRRVVSGSSYEGCVFRHAFFQTPVAGTPSGRGEALRSFSLFSVLPSSSSLRPLPLSTPFVSYVVGCWWVLRCHVLGASGGKRGLFMIDAGLIPASPGSAVPHAFGVE